MIRPLPGDLGSYRRPRALHKQVPPTNHDALTTRQISVPWSGFWPQSCEDKHLCVCPSEHPSQQLDGQTSLGRSAATAYPAFLLPASAPAGRAQGRGRGRPFSPHTATWWSFLAPRPWHCPSSASASISHARTLLHGPVRGSPCSSNPEACPRGRLLVTTCARLEPTPLLPLGPKASLSWDSARRTKSWPNLACASHDPSTTASPRTARALWILGQPPFSFQTS